MALTLRRPRRRLLVRATVAVVAATLAATGLVAPASRSAPIVEDKEHALTSGAVGPGWTRATDTGISTQVVGVAWQGAQEGAVEVRARQDTGWGEWIRLEGDPAEGPDPGSREYRNRTTAGPVWVGPDADKVEVRVAEGELEGLKLHTIRSEDRRASAGLKPAGGAVAQPGIISRAAWGADESLRHASPGCNGQPEYAPSVRFAVVHHTVNGNSYGPGDSAAMMRAIYQFHAEVNGWCDIGYNFLVDRHGQVFEGRAGGITQPVVGAHAAGFNRQSTGVALLGTFSTDPVPPAAYSALRAVLAWKLDHHGIDPLSQLPYNGRAVAAVNGHRDVNATDCPGNSLYGLLPQLRSELAGMVNIPSRTAFTSANSNKVADVPANTQSPGAGIVQWAWNGGVNQQWRLVPVGADFYKIVSVGSGMVLDVGGGSGADGAPILQWPWHGGLNQQWYVLPLGGNPGIVLIVSRSSGKVLDVAGRSTADGGRILQWSWHGGANQVWVRSTF